MLHCLVDMCQNISDKLNISTTRSLSCPMEAACWYEMVHFYQTSRHIPQDSNHNTYCWDYPKCHYIFKSSFISSVYCDGMQSNFRTQWYNKLPSLSLSLFSYLFLVFILLSNSELHKLDFPRPAHQSLTSKFPQFHVPIITVQMQFS
jgi:hypothetical protein